MEKAKGVVTSVKKFTSKKGNDYWRAIIGEVEFLFFDSKIADCEGQEIEIEYTIKTDDRGTTYSGNFPGSGRPTGGGFQKKGTSPEELKQKSIDMKLRTKTMIFSYAKDLVISNHGDSGSRIPESVTAEMDVYIQHMLKLVAGNIKELEG